MGSGVRAGAGGMAAPTGVHRLPGTAAAAPPPHAELTAAKSFPAGISLKTQELYALVFLTRYLDLFYSYISL